MGKQQGDPAREQHWRQLVSEWRASGLSVREFCSQRQVTEATFYAWRRELQRRDATSGQSQRLSPLALADMRHIELVAADRNTVPAGALIAIRPRRPRRPANRISVRTLLSSRVRLCPWDYHWIDCRSRESSR